ncbi:hypothetical protein [Methylobacterium sp. J-067]|uniref:hypothetical protein n=1 Tax=Methylobacterium sp. J-067 TaxID=2836648 RepID=UPI001FBBD662|nr:hypothetical protein [Methylobacterium sp. J-067]MCJ2023237.1 hypothetical protein [Methylobacterium sp. J-067]
MRAHGDGKIVENATFKTPEAAMAAYRLLLDREDLVGQPMAAVFKPPRDVIEAGNRATWFSRYDRDLGQGRIAGDDPRLDPLARGYDADSALNSPGLRRAWPVDWEADERPLAECLKAWAKVRGGRDTAAAALRVSRKTFDGWCDGRGAGQEAMVRRLMTLTDANT